ncbi:MAG: hypothetical protein ACD_30C00074G0001 [uncultured bacterium]|nr:MAG: hypothetical protein ACD_30C00074G0001 [uncultured bacterium]
MDTANSLNDKSRILVSRNSPIALVVEVAGFIGSHVSDYLLDKDVQVIGIDDFKSGKKINLYDSIKNNRFHLLVESIVSPSILKNDALNNLPRLDYLFITLEDDDPDKYKFGIENILTVTKKLNETIDKKTKIVLVSSIELYSNKLETHQKLLKGTEKDFAKYVKINGLNGRVLRLSSLYGPRMNFSFEDPTIALIQASLNDKLHEHDESRDFITRSLYVEDAVSLIVKSVLSGSTSNKIYDGALLYPVKVSEIKQILLDPLWYESRDFKATELPPWPSPNLSKTMRELHWKPRHGLISGLKKTIAYFKENEVEVPKKEVEDYKDLGKRWSFKNIGDREQGIVNSEKAKEEESDKSENADKRGRKSERFKFLVVTLFIVFALLYPLINLVVGGLTIRYRINNSVKYLESGEFEKSLQEVKLAKNSLQSTADLVDSLKVFKRLGVASNQLTDVEQMLDLTEEGISGVEYAVSGSQALFVTTKVISGEQNLDPKPLYEKAQVELSAATNKLSKVSSSFSNEEFVNKYPEVLQTRILDLGNKLNYYRQLVEQARVASNLLPELTAVGSKKTYLILLQNNLELRPTGGFIGSYGKISFENGKITNILVDDIYNLDGGLQDVIEPPAEFKSDLGVNRWYLRDSNFDPDFPTSARQAEFFYRKEAGETVQGVIAMDLSASSKLLSAVKGLNLSEYGDFVDSGNLFEKVISHAEVSFFPGSQAKKNYLVSLQSQLFNKVFYLSNQNWPAIIQAISESLNQKHMLVYLDDPTLFSYLTSTNWAGVFPRGAVSDIGQTNDFLGVVESNMGANKSNFFLQRKYNLETTFGKEGQVQHKLTINYKNNSPSEVFPAGKYKNRLRVYLPQGAKLTKALFGEIDYTKRFSSFTDYGRSGVSALLEVAPKEQKSLFLFYELPKGLSFKEGENSYRLEIFKQPGTEADPLEWNLTYPINFDVKSGFSVSNSGAQELKVNSDLGKDLIYLINIQQK